MVASSSLVNSFSSCWEKYLLSGSNFSFWYDISAIPLNSYLKKKIMYELSSIKKIVKQFLWCFSTLRKKKLNIEFRPESVFVFFFKVFRGDKFLVLQINWMSGQKLFDLLCHFLTFERRNPLWHHLIPSDLSSLPNFGVKILFWIFFVVIHRFSKFNYYRFAWG